MDTYPNIEELTRIIGFTDWIPNDTVTFRKDFPQDMKQKIVQSLLDFANTESGHQTLLDLFNIDNFIESTDADYDVVRDALRALGTDAAAILQ